MKKYYTLFIFLFLTINVFSQTSFVKGGGDLPISLNIGFDYQFDYRSSVNTKVGMIIPMISLLPNGYRLGKDSEQEQNKTNYLKDSLIIGGTFEAGYRFHFGNSKKYSEKTHSVGIFLQYRYLKFNGSIPSLVETFFPEKSGTAEYMQIRIPEYYHGLVTGKSNLYFLGFVYARKFILNKSWQLHLELSMSKCLLATTTLEHEEAKAQTLIVRHIEDYANEKISAIYEEAIFPSLNIYIVYKIGTENKHRNSHRKRNRKSFW